MAIQQKTPQHEIPQIAADAFKANDMIMLSKVLDDYPWLSPITGDLADNIIRYIDRLGNNLKKGSVYKPLKLILSDLELYNTIKEPYQIIECVLRNAPKIKLKGQTIELLKEGYKYAQTNEQKVYALNLITREAANLSTPSSRIHEYKYVLNAKHGSHNTYKRAGESTLAELLDVTELREHRETLELITEKTNRKCKVHKAAKKLLNEPPRRTSYSAGSVRKFQPSILGSQFNNDR